TLPCRATARACWDAGRSAGLALLADLGRLAAQVAQVVELGTADVAPGGNLDLVDDRAVHRERTLDADPEADLADREGLADAGALAANHHALEDLDSRTRSEERRAGKGGRRRW